MSMIMTLKQAPAETLALLVERPELAIAFWTDPDYVPKKPPGWVRWLTRLLGGTDMTTDLPEAPPQMNRGGEWLSLEKEWHALQWLLTRPLGLGDDNEWEAPLPEGTLLGAGEPIEGSDHGYGDDRAVSASDVAAFDTLLQRTPWETLDSYYDPQTMNDAGIYPTQWEDARCRDEVHNSFTQLKDFIHQANERSLGVVIQLG